MFGLLGKSLGHSFSKDYFTKKFSELNLNYSYQNIEIENISDIIPFVKENKNLKGFNVTVPYKESIIPYLDEIDAVAKEVGAVNTVKVENGMLKGFNTDVIGFGKLLEETTRLQDYKTTSDERALILGSGGASKAVQYVLRKENIPFRIASRGFELGVRSEELGVGNVETSPLWRLHKLGISYEEINATGFKPYSIIINTTPVGMFPNVNECLELPYSTIESRHIFIDLIYNPEETLFLKNARLKGASTYNGLKMLHEQAEASWRIWNNS
ncbi:MAG: shikimate dehydrogenase [Bacteroidales bacterium]|nr:shikimate dehydrogenase [Bacteroidales bacterium]